MGLKVDKVQFHLRPFYFLIWQRSAAWFWFQNYSKVQIARRPPSQPHNLRPSLNFTIYSLNIPSFGLKHLSLKKLKMLFLFYSVSKLINNLNSNLDIELMGKSRVRDLPSNQCLVVLSISCPNQFAIALICERIQISILY